jgi:hypothetical protein
VPELNDGCAQAKTRPLGKKSEQRTNDKATRGQDNAVAISFQNGCQIHRIPQ